MSRRDPLVYVHHILDHAREARDMSANRSREDLDTDRMFELALIRLMEIIGEASRRIPEDFRIRYPLVPWLGMSNLRNRLIHGYDQVDFNRLWGIVENELSPMIEQMEAVLALEERSGCRHLG